jgi:hypothetical protein
MNQNRTHDRDMPNRQSNMEQAEGSNAQERGRAQDRGGRGSAREHESSVMDDQDTFEHGSGGSGVSKGMSQTGERGAGSGGERHRGGITNRGADRERMEQDQLPERGRSQSER